MAAVPQAVRDRAQREENALREQGIDPNGPPVAVQAGTVSTPSQAPSTPVSVAPAQVDDAAALRAENERLRAELSTQGGRVSSTAAEVAELKQRFDLINSNRSFLESSMTELATKNQELERQLQEAQSSRTKSHAFTVAESLDESGPTEEQIQQYGESQDYVERIVKKTMAGVIKPLVAQIAEMEKALARVKDIDAKLPKLEQSAKVADINTARSREEQFLRAEILPHFPDFETVRTTSEWKEYLSRDTGKGYPVGQLLKVYRDQGDAQGIRAVLGGFYDKRDKPTLDSLAVPAKSAADAPSTAAPAKMKASEYKANLRAMTSKRLSKADWEAYRARWDQALQAGNVEMDTELR
jgi:hypothetical protein